MGNDPVLARRQLRQPRVMSHFSPDTGIKYDRALVLPWSRDHRSHFSPHNDNNCDIWRVGPEGTSVRLRRIGASACL